MSSKAKELQRGREVEDDLKMFSSKEGLIHAPKQGKKLQRWREVEDGLKCI